MNINNVNPAENKKRLGFIIKKRENELYICEWNSENRSHFGTVVSFASKIESKDSLFMSKPASGIQFEVQNNDIEMSSSLQPNNVSDRVYELVYIGKCKSRRRSE